MARKFIIFVVVILVGAAAFAVFNKFSGGGTQQVLAPAEGDKVSESAARGTADTSRGTVPPEGQKVIIYTDEGFSPNPLTTKVGHRVFFRNESSRPMWPASAMHPTHKVYPGSGLEKCGTADEFDIFDACRGIVPGSEWGFTFSEAGNWKYHDHLNASKFGAIVVE